MFPVQTYKAFLPAMIANNHGHLVSIASSAGLIGVNGLAGVGFITTSNIISFPENQLISASTYTVDVLSCSDYIRLPRLFLLKFHSFECLASFCR